MEKRAHREHNFAELADVISKALDEDNFIIAYVDGEKRTVSFDQFRRDITEIRQLIEELYRERELRVAALAGRSCYMWMVLDLACLLSGVVTLAIPETCSELEVRSIIEEFSPGVIFCQSCLKINIEHQNIVKFSEISLISNFENRAEYEINYRITDKDYYTIAFTSGTQGPAKRLLIDYPKITDPPGYIGIPPHESSPPEGGMTMIWTSFSHYLQRWLVLYSLFKNNSILISDTAHCLEHLRHNPVSFMIAPPSLYERWAKTITARIQRLDPFQRAAYQLFWLLGMNRNQNSYGLAKKIRQFVFGSNWPVFDVPYREFYWSGAGIARDCLIQLDRAGVQVFGGYGISEIGPISSDYPGRFKIGSVGIPNRDIKLNDISEILVKIDSHIRDKSQLNIVCEKYISTGDIGFIDKDGYLFIKGRADNIIILSNGKNVNPVEIEYVLRNSITIDDACVFSIDNERMSAILVSNSQDPSVSDIYDAVKLANSKLRSYQKIRNYSVIDQYFYKKNILTRSEKVKRKSLSEIYRKLPKTPT